MTQRRKRYDRQFKVSAAKVVLPRETTVEDLSEELGVKDSTSRRWACECEEMGNDGGLVSHDGQGARCASRSLRRCLDSHGTAQSASRPGTPPDNAAAEPFFKTLKGESVEGRSHGTRDGAKRGIFRHIEPYRNRVRMHSSLGCMPPVEHERQHA